ncbi:sugar ABC transporter substrate-binding protein [Arthrobacter sp. FW306-2-2C-D06B]|uniref:sugar ABC transporter substrate-binding protein n=1 Tax=Arthrobacter sp. FW306-2-2C-D06B TaxID=2879618 RepID=UPI001F41F3CE|nr:substrate-binding domain-containing protein [Arthrobacter sp. FW306-2-2C-D06B]UKA59439.1 substrate-binding domain-containing protein [Arthrobacter sp. FW306-2-2C-D06B]
MIQHSLTGQQSNRKWTSVRAAAVLSAGMLALSACAGAPGNAGGPKEDYYLPENLALYAPDSATVLKPAPGNPVTGPVTKQTLTLPYAGALPVPDGPIGDPAKTYTFCFSQGLANNPWSTAQKESLMIEAAKHPNVQIKYTETNDPSAQVADLQSCVSQKVNGILVFPQSVGPLTPAIDAVCKAGIFVIGMERTVDTDCPDSWIYLDYKQGAIQIANTIGDSLKGKGTVVETQGTMGSSPQILRHEGFIATLKSKYPDITLNETSPGDFDRTKAYQAALSFLQSPQGQKIDAWYTQYSEMALGVYAAMQQTGRTNIPLYTWGDDKATTAAIQRGEVLAAVPATPLHADLALRVAIQAIDKKDFPKRIMLQQPLLLTKENADAYDKTTWGSAG